MRSRCGELSTVRRFGGNAAFVYDRLIYFLSEFSLSPACVCECAPVIVNVRWPSVIMIIAAKVASTSSSTSKVDAWLLSLSSWLCVGGPFWWQKMMWFGAVRCVCVHASHYADDDNTIGDCRKWHKATDNTLRRMWCGIGFRDDAKDENGIRTLQTHLHRSASDRSAITNTLAGKYVNAWRARTHTDTCARTSCEAFMHIPNHFTHKMCVWRRI